MKKKFNMQLPLSFKESFSLLCKSGNDVRSWKTATADIENGYIEWKQSFISLNR